MYFLGGIGVLLLKQWGAWLYLVSLPSIWISNVFLGPSVEHAVPDSLGGISSVLDGLIIGLAFFSGARSGQHEGSESIA